MNTNNIILRVTLAIVLFMHSIPGIFDQGINGFGTYLDSVGFAPLGLALAWLIKLTHVANAIALLAQKWIIPTSIPTIIILLAGIVMVHWPNGWFVVGGGTNGIEYNVLLIACLLQLMVNEKNAAKAN